MVWKVDESGELGKVVEKGAIGMILATCLLGLQTQWHVYRRHRNHATQQSDSSGAIWENPMIATDDATLQTDTMISVTFTEAGSLGIRLEPNSNFGLIELVGIDAGTQAEKHPQLREGLMLHVVADAEDVRSMSLKEQQALLDSVYDSRPLRLIFKPGVMAASTVTAVEQVSAPFGSLRDLIG